MKLVTLEVQLKEDEELPVANLEDGEHIEVRITPLKELYAHLEGQFLDFTFRVSLIRSSNSLQRTGIHRRRTPLSFRSWNRRRAEVSALIGIHHIVASIHCEQAGVKPESRECAI